MNLKLVSVKKIARDAKIAIHRFPMAVSSALIGTVIGIMLLHIDNPSFYPAILMTLALGFPLFIAIVSISEQRKWTFNKKFIVNGAATIFLIAYYFWLPDNIFEAQISFIIRYIMWSIGFVLLVTFLPFFKKNDEKIIDKFWHYNRILFSSLALTIFWALAIQAGLSIAIASVDFLFNVNVNPERYAELWIIVVGLFSTTFFLSRIPKNIQYFEEAHDYPKELRLFSQYVLVPLVTLYFLILYAYVIRILILWEWPKGVLAYMILAFSLLGVFTYVGLYPLRDKISWIRKAGNMFHIVLIPQVGMLFWALWFRISQYAFTENRYFVFVFGWWLLAMALYFIISRKKDIRIIPVTIFVIALLSSFGSWGAFSVSEKSQTNRLENLLIENNLLSDGMIQESTGEISFDDLREISAIIRYLNGVHGLSSIQPWFDIDLSTLEDKDENTGRRHTSYSLPKKVIEEIIGIDYVEQWEVLNREDRYFNFYVDYQEQGKLRDISRYDYMIVLRGALKDTEEINGAQYVFDINNDNDSFVVLRGGDMVAQASFREFLDGLFQRGKQGSLGQDEMKIEFNNENISFSLNFVSISGEKKNDEYIITSMNAELFFILNNPQDF